MGRAGAGATAKACPQAEQNTAPAAIWAPHFEQYTGSPSFSSSSRDRTTCGAHRTDIHGVGSMEWAGPLGLARRVSLRNAHNAGAKGIDRSFRRCSRKR